MVDVYYVKPPTQEAVPSKQYPAENEILCKKLTNWLNGAIPGERFCYYMGAYVAGNSVGRIAFRAYERGDVLLFQKREGPHFSYWVQRIKNWRQ